jgi:hypothetical protein
MLPKQTPNHPKKPSKKANNQTHQTKTTLNYPNLTLKSQLIKEKIFIPRLHA